MHLISLALGIALLDLTLSGDNALVIAAVARHLPPRQRLLAILCGGAGAILLRILLTVWASVVLALPWLELLGGVVLILLALRLLATRSSDTGSTHRSSSHFFPALGMIILADLTMSLDNILTVGILAHGSIFAVVLGLLGSIGILLAGSALITSLLQRLSWLSDIAAFVLAWTAAGMLAVGFHLRAFAWIAYVLVFFLFCCAALRRFLLFPMLRKRSTK